VCDRDGVSKPVLFAWILALMLLEIQHLKWIWWENWDCRGCSAKHKDCSCGETPLWVMYL